MRKLYICLLIAFLVVGGVMIYVNEEHASTVQILSFHQTYSRLITSENEDLTIPIFASSNDSFLMDIDSVSSCMIYDDQNQMVVAIKDVEQKLDSTYFQGNTYYPYDLHITFDVIQLNAIEFTDAYLQISYENGDQIAFEIGSIYLYFESIQNEQHIDMMRLFSTVKHQEDIEYISGIVIGIENRSMLDTQIIEINSLIPNMQFDLEHAIYLIDVPTYDTDIDDIVGYSYSSIQTLTESGHIILEGNHLLYIPVAYKDNIISVNRFPLIIQYTYLNEPYTYIIDDFLFYSSNNSLEVNHGQIREYIYHY